MYFYIEIKQKYAFIIHVKLNITIILQEAMIVRTVSPSVAMGLIASREFIDLMMLRFLDDGQTAMTVGISVEHKDYPAQSSPVRGKNYPCGSILTKM